MAVKVRDANKDGSISLADFELVLKRYGEITKASKEKLECARVHMLDNICRGMGITDSTKSLSYEEVKRGLARIADTHSKENFFLDLFKVIDVDDDGTISFQEWEIH